MNPVYVNKYAHAIREPIIPRGRERLFRRPRQSARAIVSALLTLILCSFFIAHVVAQSESETPAHIVAAARHALPQLADAQDWSHTLVTGVGTTALGCRPMRGLQLPQPIEVYRLTLIDKMLHVSADGSMTQQCANEGIGASAGLIYASIASERDRDGDSLADSVDACPSIAGLADADRPGCPRASRGDSDGDGSANSVDACPRQAGSAAAGGCSLFVDEDGDGVPDSEDICPRDFGVIRSDFALGCPADGSGYSDKRSEASEACAFRGDGIPLYEGPSLAASVIRTIDASSDESAEIIGRDATGFWYQIQSGWIPGSAIELRGACYNLPLVNMAPGVGSGCYLRPRESTINVRRAPRAKQVAQISPENSHVVLGANLAGDWLFFRQGWVSRSVLELAGDCDNLPVLDPTKVSSGSVHFCPPLYQGFLPPRIDVGPASARIASGTLANRLRAEPALSAQQIGEIPPRQVLDAVLDGPACDGAFVWWQVEVEGLIGWTAESDRNANVYYLEPVAAPVSETTESASGGLNPARDQSLGELSPDMAMMISSANLNRLDRTHVIPVDDPLQVAWSPSMQSLAVLLASGELQFYRYPGFDPISIDLRSPAGFQTKAFDLSSDDKLAIGSQAGAVSLVTLDENGSAATTMQLSPLLPGAVRDLDWSADGNLLAAASGDQPSRLAGRGGALVVWQIDNLQAAPRAEATLHFAFPYPLSDIAFSADGRWLAVAGEHVASRRAALWVYDAADGRLVFSKALVGMGGQGLARALPSAELGDFFYSNGDSLYLVDIDSGKDKRFYHRAGAIMPRLGIRRPVIAGAEILLAIASQDANSEAQLHFVNAMNSDSPTAQLPIALDDLAFSPDGRAIALAQRSRDRVLILSVAPG